MGRGQQPVVGFGRVYRSAPTAGRYPKWYIEPQRPQRATEAERNKQRDKQRDKQRVIENAEKQAECLDTHRAVV